MTERTWYDVRKENESYRTWILYTTIVKQIYLITVDYNYYPR